MEWLAYLERFFTFRKSNQTFVCKTFLEPFFCPLEKNFILSWDIPHLISFVRLKSKISRFINFSWRRSYFLSFFLLKSPCFKMQKIFKLYDWALGVYLSLIQVGGFTVGRRLAPPSDTLALRARAPKTSTRLFNLTDLIYPQKSSLAMLCFCHWKNHSNSSNEC